jgi:hypothetical protein
LARETGEKTARDEGENLRTTNLGARGERAVEA